MTEASRPAKTDKPGMIPVRLLKNYRPSGEYQIVGEPAPPPLPGVSFTSKDKDGNIVGEKLWEGTTVLLPRDEAAKLISNMAESMEAKIGHDGKPLRNQKGDVVRERITRKFPLAERADPLPV